MSASLCRSPIDLGKMGVGHTSGTAASEDSTVIRGTPSGGSTEDISSIETDKKINGIFATMPGVVALGIWVAVYVPILFVLNRTVGRCQNFQAQEILSLPVEQFIEITGLCVFIACILLDLASTAMQVSPKKRQLCSIILFINSVCACVYSTMVFQLAPTLVTAKGNDISSYGMNMFEWCFTTPAMIIIIDSLGTPLSRHVVSNWRVVGKLLVFDELMLMFGFVALYVGEGPVMYISFGISCLCFMVVCMGIHQSVERSIVRSDTSFEAASIRYLEISTFLLWSCFPILHVAAEVGILTPVQHTLGRVICDVVAKTVYSVALLSGNFCLLDTVAELRVLQLRESQRDKEGKIVKVERMNEALQVAVMEAETSARLSRRFVANVSHELRTPLNSVINFNSLLLDAGLEDVHQEYVSSALTSAQALLGIINQVLDFSKLESSADSIHLEVEPFHFASLCEDVEDIVAARISERNVDFSVRCPLKCPCLIGDRFRIRQCLINLSDNAVKFADPADGRVQLVVGITPDADPGYMKITMEVIDNGMGIPKEKLGLLFKPFSQVENGYARQHGGTGLGLAITKKIFEAMEGTIHCNSQYGHGTTFYAQIRLPVASAGEAIAEPPYTTVKLDGSVVICLLPSLSTDMVRDYCLAFGLGVKDHSNEDVDMTQVACNFINERKPEILIVDYELHLKLLKLCPRIEAGKILVVGKLSAQAGAVFKGQVDIQGFVATPIKPSVLFSRLQGRLSGHGIAFENGKLTSDLPAGGPVPGGHSDSNTPTAAMPMTRAPTITKGASTSALLRVGSNLTGKDTTYRVLIVEDQPVNQKVAIAMITKAWGKNGVSFETAEHGVEGLERATQSNHDFDLIIMDCQMPLMDGLECTRKIREWESLHNPAIPYYVIAMTAHASKDDVRDCLTAGMDDYCSKPLSMPVLKEALGRFQTWMQDQKSDS